MTSLPQTADSRIRHSARALAHAMSIPAWRGAFEMRQPDAWLLPALKVGFAVTVVLVAGGLMGKEQLAGIASLGALVSAFGRYQPYTRLARQLALVSVAVLFSAGIGALLGALDAPAVLSILVLSLVAGAASVGLAAFRITGPGPVILVFAAAAGTGYSRSLADVPVVLGTIALGIVVGLAVALAPALVIPLHPARLAAARALAAVAKLEKHDDDAHRRAALAAVSAARGTLAHSSRLARPGTVTGSAQRLAQAHRLAELLEQAEEALVHGASGTAGTARLRELAAHEPHLRKLTRRMDLPHTPRKAPGMIQAEGFFASARVRITDPAAIQQAIRMAAASALAGWIAVVLGFEHPLWASMGAIAALQGFTFSTAVQRGIQRLLGNVLGALLAAGLLAAGLGFWPTVVAVILLQTAAELLVMRNYALTSMAVAPMSLLLTGLGTHMGPELALSRVADTLVGVVFGVLVAAVSISLADRHHLRVVTA